MAKQAAVYRPMSLFLALRYLVSRQKRGFAAFISASSTLGIALGVMVLILVLSAMNGFERELAQRLLSVVAHGELISVNQPIDNWRTAVDKVEQQEHVTGAAPFIKIPGMMQKSNALKAVEFRGVDLALEQKVSTITEYLVEGDWQTLANNNSVVIGSGVAKKLGVGVGDKVQLLLPQQRANVGSIGAGQQGLSGRFPAPKVRHVTIAAIFKFGGTIDDTLAYISLAQAADVQGYREDQVEGIRLQVDQVFAAQNIVRQVAYSFDHYVYIHDWTRTEGHLFNDIQLVRTVMFVVLILVIAVASFNIVSTLIMVVNEKQGDIAILKTMGASNGLVMMTFVLQGLANGIVGVVLGGTLGVYLANNLTALISAIEQSFGVQFLSGDVYFINYLPSHLIWSDVYITVSVAMVMSLLATFYPAWRATKVEPAQVLGQL